VLGSMLATASRSIARFALLEYRFAREDVRYSYAARSAILPFAKQMILPGVPVRYSSEAILLFLPTNLHEKRIGSWFSLASPIKTSARFLIKRRIKAISLSSHPAIQLSSYPAIQLSSYPAIQLSSYPAIQLSSYPAIQLSSYPAIQPSCYPACELG